MQIIVACAALGLAAGPAAAVELSLPNGARQISERSSPSGSYALPTGPFADGAIPSQRLEGRIVQQTWRFDAHGQTTLQIFAPLREQIESAGFAVALDCKDTECGGFDFRFGTEVVPAPDMYVDIRNFRFLSAIGQSGEAVSLLVSGNRSASYVQIIYVNPTSGAASIAIAEDVKEPEQKPDDLASVLTETGHVVLGDLVFETGASALDPGNYASLAELAAFLEAHPDIVIALVGHTDSIGELSGNIALSRQRAESVRDRLVSTYGIDPQRVQADGMGYLAPIASNLTSEGREANRRVEAIIVSDG